MPDSLDKETIVLRISPLPTLPVPLKIALLAGLLAVLPACGSEERVGSNDGVTTIVDDPANSNAGQSTDGESPSTDGGTDNSGTTGGATTGASDGGTTGSNGTPPLADVASNENFELSVDSTSIDLVEGEAAVDITLSLSRTAGFTRPVRIAAELEPTAADLPFVVDIIDPLIARNEVRTRIAIQLGIGALPLLPQSFTVKLSGTDEDNAPVELRVELNVTPTSRPDVYLLVGQSNMVGFSALNERDEGPGGLDEPDPRILQLNATGNDRTNFSRAADFTNPDNQVGSPRYSNALDPLHDGFDPRLNGKTNTLIGLGLSFAKRALADTSANVILVPAAWSDTGFCKRSSNVLPGSGWNPLPQRNAAFAGTLLYERAVLRANLALADTDGVLRGILWHQGEADSDDATCAAAYKRNLTALIGALRTNIDRDARGPAARRAAADIPFIVGTMSKGADQRGALAPFDDTKSLVDDAHRTIGGEVDFVASVNNDDLVPPQFPCGEGSCIHFGATAYREMGVRYYDQMRALFSAP